MNKLNFRNSKKGITPVIATIILIAVTLVLALVVGAYTFGLFGANTKTITVSSANLNASNGVLTFAMSNPGSAATVTSLTLSGASLGTPITSWTFTVSGSTVVDSSVTGGGVTTLTATPSPSQSLTSGQTFNYVLAFSNGQSVSGVVIAQ
ncbi:MAG: archaellin/type IV pilin N-terminal domain-containing protein [Nitrososphaerales archaeon]